MEKKEKRTVGKQERKNEKNEKNEKKDKNEKNDKKDKKKRWKRRKKGKYGSRKVGKKEGPLCPTFGAPAEIVGVAKREY